jgi:hypothetical protein
LSDFLNPKYVPLTTAACDLFWEKQKFLYAVLEAKVETAKGKSIIREYESSYDTQKAYEKLEQHHLTSNSAMFSANKIMEYLTTIRINDGSCHSSLENFNFKWQEQFRRYKRLVPTTYPCREEKKLAMLQVAANFER